MDPNFRNPLFRQRIAEKLSFTRGAIILVPELTFIDESVDIGRGTIIEPGARLFGKTIVGENCRIEGDVRLVNVTCGNNCTILGPVVIEDSAFGDNATIGPFAQIKRCTIGKRFTAKHACYLGDMIAGDNVNIGAGTITANWNGEEKQKTVLGDDCFIGVNTIFIAPLVLGDEAGTAAGTIVTKNVPSRSLAIRREKIQTNLSNFVKKTKTGWKLEKAVRSKKPRA